ncbi:MAG: protein ImuB [Solirubrobacterales bacterium]|jgi:protein ImuB|nr:protein ImuB [Solirubrobacterales bacterium]
MIVCALIPRLSLSSALGDRRELFGRPVALAPEPGGPQVIGEASGAAEAFGVRAGMRLGEALSRCPALTLVAPDPVRAEAVWERSLRALESIGARVEPARPGEAFFAAAPLRGLHGEVESVLARARRVLRPPARVGAGPNRLCARAAAARMRARRPSTVVTGTAARRLLAELPVDALRDRFGDEWAGAEIPETLRRLGVRTLGELAALPAEAVADRFGKPGLVALRLARGADQPLRPRHPHDEIECRLGLPEAASGQQLEQALGLLVERLLAHPARAERTIRRLRIEARLAGAGGWRCEVALRSASADSERLLLALAPRLSELPGPASWLGLRAVELGPEAGEQGTLGRSPAEERRGRLTEAVRQVRSAAGRDAVLRVLEIDPRSRVPERRAILAPFSDRDG